MECPVCKHVMVVLELDQVEIDYCTNCSGIWLDSGELELLFENEIEWDALFKTFVEDKSNPEKKYRCPICGKKMLKVFAGENKEVLIDKCSNNDGLWFDKGELKSVMELGIKGGHSKIVDLLKEMFEHKLSTNKNGEN